MVKNLIKRVLRQTIGVPRTRAIVRWMKGAPRSFSEAELILSVLERRKEAGVMIDVGAHFGESFAPYLEMGWRIFAFEPDQANRDKLCKAVDASRIRLFNCAVGDHENDAVSFFASDESSGISSLSAFRDTHREVGRVRLTTLARALQPEGVNHVDFLKVDTEGHDLFVLKGYPWDKDLPDVVLCEFEDYKTVPLGYSHRELGDFLLSRGYSVFLSEWAPIVKYGADHAWRTFKKYPVLLAEPKGWGNFVAFRPDSDLSLVDQYLQTFNRPQ